MKLEKYELVADEDLCVYQFTSEGPHGKIKKCVYYSKTNVTNVYNLAFGDMNPLTGRIDDRARTNNGDSKKVLATVASTIYKFTGRYPTAYIHIMGSTKARTRLYRMSISNNLSEISQDFKIYGFRNGEWTVFEKRIEYKAFLIVKKNT
jgi:hypothetical protein